MKKRGKKVLELSRKITRRLRPFCSKIEVAGSIRRKAKNPGDIDIVLAARSDKDKEKIKKSLSKWGRFLQGREKIMFFRIEGVEIQLFFTTTLEWGAGLLAYSGKKGSNIGLRVVAMKKGYKLTNHGLFRKSDGKRIAGRTERGIYKALGRPYKEPWER